MNKPYCKSCQEQCFNEKGIIKTRGIVFFNCTDCHEKSANFVMGQTTICHSCAEKLGVCAICGRKF